MAENKKSFIAYVDWGDVFKELPDKEAGQLVKHLFAYVNDENPQTDSVLIKAVFTQIKNALKRDLSKYENYIEKQRLNGLKGGRPKKEDNPKKGLGYLENPSKPKKADSVSDSDSDINNNRDSQHNAESSFKLFWDHFHAVTNKPKTDKEPAYKYWKALKWEERRMAFSNVKKWYASQNPKFCKIARTYLKDKSFNDETAIEVKEEAKPIHEQVHANQMCYDQMMGAIPIKKGIHAGKYFDSFNQKISDVPLIKINPDYESI